MAITSAETEAYYDSFSKGNGVQRFVVTGAPGGINGTVTVKAAVTDAQIYAKGHVSVPAATTITFYSAAAGTVIGSLVFVAAGTQAIPRQVATIASELLQMKCSANITPVAVIDTIPIPAGQPIPPEWA